jgi:hypothetical protein
MFVFYSLVEIQNSVVVVVVFMMVCVLKKKKIHESGCVSSKLIELKIELLVVVVD